MFKRKMNIAQLQGLDQAFTKSLDTGTILKIIMPYILLALAGSIILFMNIIIGIIIAILAFLYSYFILLPQELRKRNYQLGLDQRSIFVSIVAQILQTDSSTLSDALLGIKDSIDGDFKLKVERLNNAILSHQSDQEVAEAFDNLRESYKDDIFFCQFIDILQQYEDSGHKNIASISRAAEGYDKYYSEQEDYIEQRRSSLMISLIMTVAIFLLWLMVALMFGIEVWHKEYSSTVIGYLFNIPTMILYAMVINNCFNHYYDESLTTLTKSKL